MKKKFTLKNKRRFTLFLMTVLLTASTIIYTGSVYAFKEPVYKNVVVTKGDTLWDLAKEYGKGKDIRKFIYDIRKLNNLANSDIFEGDNLLVPYS